MKKKTICLSILVVFVTLVLLSFLLRNYYMQTAIFSHRQAVLNLQWQQTDEETYYTLFAKENNLFPDAAVNQIRKWEKEQQQTEANPIQFRPIQIFGYTNTQPLQVECGCYAWCAQAGEKLWLMPNSIAGGYSRLNAKLPSQWVTTEQAYCSLKIEPQDKLSLVYRGRIQVDGAFTKLLGISGQLQQNHYQQENGDYLLWFDAVLPGELTQSNYISSVQQ